MRSPSTLTCLLLLLSVLTPTICNSSAPVLSSSKPPAQSPESCAPEATTDSCKSTREEDIILCEAASLKRDSIRQVIAEDPTTNLPDSSDPAPPPADRAADVWNAAFKQWIATQPGADARPAAAAAATATASESTQRAIDSARKRLIAASQKNRATSAAHDVTDAPSAAASEADPPANTTHSLDAMTNGDGDGDDDELTLITRAAHVLRASPDPEVRTRALLLVDELCAGGDNGRQFANAGGLPALIALLGDADRSVGTCAARALASCSQNNAAVFDAAIEAGAVPALVRAAAATATAGEGKGKGGVKDETDEIALRAAALRALVAVAEAEKAEKALWEQRDAVIKVVVEVVNTAAGDGVEMSADARRGLLRGLATVETCVRKGERWRGVFVGAGVLDGGVAAMRSSDFDVREGAARVVQLLRHT